jgi:hypothetical protein
MPAEEQSMIGSESHRVGEVGARQRPTPTNRIPLDHGCARPVDRIRATQFRQKNGLQQAPTASRLSASELPLTGHSGAAHLPRQYLQGVSRLGDEQYPSQRCSIINPRSAYS